MDGLTRDHFGKRTDKTMKRDLEISQWHRNKLSNKCYGTDIDFYEYRFLNGNFVPKAIMEYKAMHVTQEKYVLSANTKAIYELAKKAGIKFYFVWYEKEGNIFKFKVWNVTENPFFDKRYKNHVRDMDENTFINLMECL
ncbi:MAG: hypothetical protein HF967_01920 [Methanosarcinales archaeon]|nr:hypothetical protein [Methanosarcinales archaeon]